MIQNVETLANLALLARYGADWYRELGTEAKSGSRLVTLCPGAVQRPGVYGSMRHALPGSSAAGGLSSPSPPAWSAELRSVAAPSALGELELSNAGLRRHGAGLGCGAVVALPASSCPVAETVRVAVYLATETAGQCGPCVHGSAAIARTLHGIAEGRGTRAAFADLAGWTAELPGRGALSSPERARPLRWLRAASVRRPVRRPRAQRRVSPPARRSGFDNP